MSYSPEITLWRSVLLTAIEDCLFLSTKDKRRMACVSDRKRKKITLGKLFEAHRARQYMSINNKNFRDVCGFALLDPEYVIDHFLKRMKEEDSIVLLQVECTPPILPVMTDKGILETRTQRTYDNALALIEQWNTSFRGARAVLVKKKIKLIPQPEASEEKDAGQEY